MKTTVFSKIIILGLLAILPLSFSESTLATDIAKPASTTAQTAPNELVEEVWQIINVQYIDGQIIKSKWQELRKLYLDTKYSSMADAYNATRKMLSNLNDPGTKFFDPTEFKELQGSDAQLGGIGLQISQNEKINKIVVVAPIRDTPAEKAGVLANDIITEINGKNTEGMGTTKAATLLRDKIGTFVNLTVIRDGQPIKFRIKREQIVIHPVDYSVRETTSGKVGYIRLKQFSSDAASEMKTAISTLESSGVVGYILDLRSNPGGLLYGTIDIARMWLDDGKIVSILNRKATEDVSSANRTAITKKPLVILVDRGSASGSEILAGALQDNQRAKIVGTGTFRNGTIQSVRPLSGGAGLAVTIAKYYTPKGSDINRNGIAPDVIVKLKKSDIQMLIKDRSLFATLADPQYKRAMEELLQLVK